MLINLDRDDEGLSDIFVELERENIHVIDNAGTCYIWSDKTKLWEQHHKGHISNQISTTLEHVIDEEMAREGGENRLKHLKRRQSYVLSTAGCSAVLRKVLLKLEDLKFKEKLNTNPDLLPLKDGQVVCLHTAQVRERTRGDMFFLLNVLLPLVSMMRNMTELSALC